MKKHFIISTLLASLLSPALVSAEVSIVTDSTTTVIVTTSTAPTPAQIFTACSQVSIEKRDNAISVARAAYNISMTNALSARKDAEKTAVALEETSDSREVTRTALNAYKKAVQTAQETLTKARKDAWDAFESDSKECRNIKQDTHASATVEQKEGVEKKKEETKGVIEMKKVEVKEIRAEGKEASSEKKTEIKTFRESFQEKIDAIRAFFTRKSTSATTINANASVTTP